MKHIFFGKRQSGLSNTFMDEFYRTLNNNLPSGVTRVGELAKLHDALNSVIEQCTFKERRFEGVERRGTLTDHLIPCLKRVLIAKRRHEANHADLTQKTHNQEVIEEIEKDARRLDEFVATSLAQECSANKNASGCRVPFN